jgi:hypothetical protein
MKTIIDIHRYGGDPETDGTSARKAQAPEPERPTIKTHDRHLRDMTAEATMALQAANNQPVLFVRGGAVTQVREDEHG